MPTDHRRRRRLPIGISLAAALLAGVSVWTGIASAATEGGAGAATPTQLTAAKKSVIVIGSTDKPVSFDPATAFDAASWLIQRGLYQTLLVVRPGGGAPVADASAAASSCKFRTPTSYVCTLKKNLKFSEGTPVTSQDVENSIQRIRNINAPGASARTFSNLDTMSTPNSRTIVFNLKNPDATWPYVLSSPATSIVPARYYPANAQISSHFVGSGPYALAKYAPGVQVVLQLNRHWTGPQQKNSLVIVQYFDTSSALKLALQQGAVDVAFHSLDPSDVRALRTDKNLQVLSGNGSQMDELQFDLTSAPGSNPAVRKAVAYVVDRQALVKNVYGDTREPAYSMVPNGFLGHVDAFAKVYGKKPNVALAKKTLADAGVATPVALDLWFTPTHYGTATADEMTEIKRQLEATKLFKVTINSTEWVSYLSAVQKHQYPVYNFGWFGQFPDPDAFLTWFYAKNALFGGGYANADVQQDVVAEETAQTTAARVKALSDLQMIAAKDTPIIPLLQGNTVAVVRKGVTGVKPVLDVTNSLRFWLIGKQ